MLIGISGKVKSFFGAGSKEETSSEPDAAESTPTAKIDRTDETDLPPASEFSSSPSASPTPEKKEIKDTIALKLDVKPLSIPALSPAELRRARDK